MSLTGLDKFWNGGFFEETLCIPYRILNIFLSFLFPPLAVAVDEYNKGFNNPSRILVCVLYTLLFYFPGVIYALHTNKCKKRGNEDSEYY